MQPWSIVRQPQRLELSGDLRFEDASQIWSTLRRLANEPGTTLDLDLSRARVIDGDIMALVIDVRSSLLARGVRSELAGIPERLEDLVLAYGGDQVLPRPAHARSPGPVVLLGAAVEHTLDGIHAAVAFIGDLTVTIGRAIRHPSTANLSTLPGLVGRAGFDGVTIVLTLNFLVGIVMAFQTARQLEYFGANLFVADVVGISMPRELAPLMTAVILSGRSGAAFAAELGTMRVAEEIDALRTMGFRPTAFLVIPRLLALIIAAPALTLLGDVSGVVGGAIVAATSLDVTWPQFLTELQRVVVYSDVWTGLVKSVAFGFVIAMIGCRRGLQTRGAAEGVGRSTTSTIVECLFTIVILDTLFTMLFREANV